MKTFTNLIKRASLSTFNKKRYYLFIIMLLTIGVGSAWAETATITFSEKGLTNGLQYSDPFEIDANTTIVFAGGENDGKYYNTGSGIRTYGEGSMTIACPNGTISEISFTFSGDLYKPTTDVATPAGYSNGKWTGSASSVTLTRPSGSGHWRLQKVVVTYEVASVAPKDKYTLTYQAGSVTGTLELEEGANLLNALKDVTPVACDPTSTTPIGWSETEITTKQATAPTLLTDASVMPSNNHNVYYVFAKENGGSGGSVTITHNSKNFPTAYGTANTFTEYELEGYKFKIQQVYKNGKMQWRASGNSNGTGTIYNTDIFPAAISSIVVEFDNSDSNKNHTLKIGDSANPTSGTSISPSKSGNTYTFDCSGKSCNYFVLTNGTNAGYTQSVTINYGAATTYSDYTTSCGTTVVETLTDAQFAWSAATAEATMGATNTFPTLTNTLGLDVTYESSNTSTATIAADGTIALVAPGTTTISAKFAGGEVGGTTYVAKTVSYTLTVHKAPATPTSTVYVKVTSTAGITDGEYLIVYEDAEGNPKAPVAFDGSLAPVKLDVASNNVEVSIASNTIAGNTDIDAATFTINTTAGTIQTKDGYYIGQTSNANGLATSTTTEYTNTISIENDGSATIISSGGAYLRYNSANDNLRFRYFKSSTYTAQKAIALYKKTNGQQLAELAYATTKYLTKLGDAFTTPTLTNPNSLTVTYSSSDNDVATVDANGAVTIKAAGVVTITASFAGNSSFLEGSASYTIGVTEHAGTQADPYSVADAKRVIDVMGTAENVYATGIVSEIVTAYNATYGNITYNISIDGTTAADQLQAYRGKGVNGENFSSANDIKVGDEVVVKGNLTKYNTTYEFDADNQLVSLKRDKQQAGLAYATTEYSTTLGESFETPTLTNPNGLTVTYSSDNTSAVEVNEETGEVTIKAVGKAKITATFAGNLTYAPGSASYTITVTAVATLPFAFDGKQADIENTPGMSHDGIDATDYKESPYLKMNTTGDWLVIRFDSQADELSYDIKGNPGQGTFSGTFAVQESEDGSTYTDLVTYTTLETTTTNKTHKLAPASRYVKFVFTEKSNGNVALGNISITKPDLRQEAGIAWSAESTTITIGDAFTAPTLSNPKGLTLSCTSDNEDLATVTNAGVVTLKEGVTGKAVITATFAGNETYKPAEVTTTIIVNPKTGDVVILAKHQGKWYAMKAEYVPEETDRLAAVPVYYVNGKLYNVSEEDKAAITWTRSAYGDNTVSFQNNGKFLKGRTTTDLILADNEDGLYKWNAEDNTMLIGETTRTFLYHKNGMFRNYSITWAGETSPSYSNLPVVTAPEFATGNLYTITATAENGTVKGEGIYVGSSTVTLMADPAMDYTFVNWTVNDIEVSTANPYEFEATANLEVVAHFQEIEQTEKKLTGTFSVGKYEVAQFATGNLQYNVQSKEWSFAKQQYQYIGDANVNVGDPAFTGTIDMFGWSADGKFGVNPSANKNDYAGEFVDWGTLFPAEDNWSTLTKDQWKYLLNQRGAGKKQIARVGTVFGVLLFPDEWTMPSGISVTAQYDSYFKVNVYNYTLAQWTELENAGALFMPAAGRRFGGYGNTYRADGITNIGEEYKLQYCTNDLAAYWTSTKNDDGTKVNYLLNLGDKGTKYSTLELGWVEYGHAGQSVRLAKVTNTLVHITEGDNTEVLNNNDGKNVDVKVTREFTTGNLYTIALPFTLENVSRVFGNQAYEYTSLGENGEDVVLYFSKTNTMESGKPYLIEPTQDVPGFIVEDVTLSNTANNIAFTVDKTTVTMIPVLSVPEGANNNGKYWLAADRYLYNNTNTLMSLRALFNISTVNGIAPRARVAFSENSTTGLDNITNGENTTIKVMENGQLIIIRNGEKFNAQGQRL